MDAPTGTRAVDRSVELLALVVRAERAPTFTELVAATGLARATVSRLLSALTRGGLVARTADGAFRAGDLFVEYATHFDTTAALVAAGRRTLEDVARRTGETVNLAVGRGEQVVHVDQVDASFVLGTVSWVGVDVPGHVSALGKVMYAWGAVPVPAGRLESRTPSSLATRAALEEDLRVTRERGYALTRGELEDGLDGIAVPVRGSDDRVVAALGVSGPTFRIGDRRPAIADLLRRSADEITRALVERLRH